MSTKNSPDKRKVSLRGHLIISKKPHKCTYISIREVLLYVCFANSIYLPFGKFDIIYLHKFRYDINSWKLIATAIYHAFWHIACETHIANSNGIYIAAECPLEHSAKRWMFFYNKRNSFYYEFLLFCMFMLFCVFLSYFCDNYRHIIILADVPWNSSI